MSIYQLYANYCQTQLHLNKTDWDFKNNPNYTYMLEHVNEMQANQYLNIIQNQFKTLYKNNLKLLTDTCILNDLFGKTNKCDFIEFMECSPTNLRYIFHSLLILEYIDEKKINNLDFIEIGGGYGGLCVFIHKLAPLFNININSYTIFDLVEASQLQYKYLNALDIDNVKCYQLDNYKDIKHNSFLVSTYAFSEIPGEIQREYIEKIINPFTKYGFIAWNHIPVYKFVNNSIIEAKEEYPLTSNSGYNAYVRFYPEPNI